MEGTSPCVPSIASVPFLNYYTLFHNVFYWRYCFLENNIFENRCFHISVKFFRDTFFKFFLEKNEILISEGGSDKNSNKNV